MRFALVPLALIFFPLLLSSQNVTQRSSSFEEELKTSFRTKPKLDIKFDNRFSFIQDNDVRTIGLKIGLSFNRKFKVGIGANQMLIPAEYSEKVGDEFIPVNLEYFYFSPYLEYVYYNSKKWEFSLASQIGIGGANYQYTNNEGNKVKLQRSIVWSYEPAMLIDYKIIRWFGVGTGVGYRLIMYKSAGVRENYSSPEYVIKLKIYLGEIVRTLTGKEWEIDD